MAEDITEIFAVVVEGGYQPPLLMETEANGTTEEAARYRLGMLLRNGYFRGCVVRLEFRSGNPLVLHDMKMLQGAGPESLPHFMRNRAETPNDGESR